MRPKYLVESSFGAMKALGEQGIGSRERIIQGEDRFVFSFVP